MDARIGQRTRLRMLRPRVLVPVVSAMSIAALCGYFLRSPSPVGHWDSADGEAEFFTAYDLAFESMPEPADTMDVRSSFGVVRVYRFAGTGEASPMLLLPGTASSTPVWADNMPSLLALGDVYTLDLLGEPGRSIQAAPIADAEDEAEWLAETITAIPENSVNLIGLSLGGWTAANLAIRRPQHVRTLTLIDPVYTFDNLPMETILRSIPASVPWLPKSARDAFNSYTAGGIEVEDMPVADMIEAGMHHYTMKKPAPTRITEQQLSDLSMPVLAIIAGRSVMHDPKTASATARRDLGTEAVHVYEDASHAITGEYPDEITGDIGDFIARP